MKTAAWMNEHGYIGAVGVDTPEEMAKAVLAEGDIVEYLEAEDWTVKDVVHALERAGIQPVRVPVAVFRQERWDGSQVSPCAIDARPGRGFIKVLGVHA